MKLTGVEKKEQRMKAARHKMTEQELWQCMAEAEHRKADRELPLDARLRSFETYSLCLHEAHCRGYDYASLRAKAEA